MKRFAAFALSFALILTLLPTSLAASSEAIEAAQTLYELGLFNGTGNNPDGTPNFDLDRVPTRAEAVTMLVRLLGKDEEAAHGTWETPFTDVANWAKPYVGYAYTNNLTTGTSATTFGGSDVITASQYLTFVLRALGYASGTDFQWDRAWEKSDEIGLTDGRYNAETTSFTRGDVAIISNRTLSINMKNSNQSLSDFLGLTVNTSTVKEITVDDLQGIWQFENGAHSFDSLYFEEYVISGNTYTHTRYIGDKDTAQVSFGHADIYEGFFVIRR